MKILHSFIISVSLILLLAAATQALAATDGYYNLTNTTTIWDGTDADRQRASSSDYASTYGDEHTVTYTLPWSFPFYGTQYSQISVDTNGNIWFSSNGAASSFPLANNGGRGPVIAAWNADLSSAYYGGAFIQHRIDGQDRVAIEWQAETYLDEGEHLLNNFETVLFPDGKIRFDYRGFAATTPQDAGSGISKGDGTLSLNLSELYSPIYTLPNQSFLFTPQPSDHQLTLAFPGNGSGSVVSSPAGIACNTSCSAPFAVGTRVTLHPEAFQYSQFSGWSGSCSGIGDCIIDMLADSTVSATFTYDNQHQVMIDNGTSTYFLSLQEAYNATQDGTVIKLWATTYNESLDCNRPVIVRLQGGYDSGYTSITGDSTLNGSLTITNGTVVIDGLNIK